MAGVAVPVEPEAKAELRMADLGHVPVPRELEADLVHDDGTVASLSLRAGPALRCG